MNKSLITYEADGMETSFCLDEGRTSILVAFRSWSAKARRFYPDHPFTARVCAAFEALNTETLAQPKAEDKNYVVLEMNNMMDRRLLDRSMGMQELLTSFICKDPTSERHEQWNARINAALLALDNKRRD